MKTQAQVLEQLKEDISQAEKALESKREHLSYLESRLKDNTFSAGCLSGLVRLVRSMKHVDWKEYEENAARAAFSSSVNHSHEDLHAITRLRGPGYDHAFL